MESLHLHADARDIGIANPVAVVIEDIEVRKLSPQLDPVVDQLMEQLAERFAQVQRSPEYQGFATLFELLGYTGQVPAGQRLVRNFLKNGFKRINNLVDAYNIVSARHACGLGLHDASAAASRCERLDIFRSSCGDTIMPLFKVDAVLVPPGDLAYGGASAPRALFASLGKRDVDSDDLKVTQATSGVLLVVLGNARTSRAFNEGICQEVLDLVRLTCRNARMRSLPLLSEGDQCRGRHRDSEGIDVTA